MPKIVLIPDIDHCIETVAKQKYDEIVRQLLASAENNQELLNMVELLKSFLETSDFKQLRMKSEKHLIDGKVVKFVVYKEDGCTKNKILIDPES
jgi:hypothetical protein